MGRGMKRQYRSIAISDHRAMEEHYEKMAGQGWILKSCAGPQERYVLDDVKALKYKVVSMKNIFKVDEKREEYEALGWIYVARNRFTMIFFADKDQEIIEDFENDEEEFNYNSGLVMRDLIWMIVASIYFFVVFMYIGSERGYRQLLSPNMDLMVGAIIFLALVWYERTMPNIRWYNKNKYNKEDLIYPSYDKVIKRHKISQVIYILLLFALMGYLAITLPTSRMAIVFLTLGLATYLTIEIFLELDEYRDIEKRKKIMIQVLSIATIWILTFTLTTKASMDTDDSANMDQDFLAIYFNSKTVQTEDAKITWYSEQSNFMVRESYWFRYNDIDGLDISGDYIDARFDFASDKIVDEILDDTRGDYELIESDRFNKIYYLSEGSKLLIQKDNHIFYLNGIEEQGSTQNELMEILDAVDRFEVIM